MKNHDFRSPAPAAQQRIDALLPGQKMQDLPVEMWHDSFRKYVLESPYRGGGPNLRLLRLAEAEPSLTVTGFVFNKFVHPSQNRYITVREAARLQGFPDEVEFQGGIGSVRQQVGNAVPPQLAAAVFSAVLEAVGHSDHPLQALSLFSGAGGLDLGARESLRIQTRIATDNWPDAVETMRAWVRESHPVVCQSILDIPDFADFWRTHAADTCIPDIVFGGPPCQSFSQAGKQNHSDERGNLVFEFVRAVGQLLPEVFVLENVSNIRGVAKGALLAELVEKFNELGYRVDHQVLNAAEFGVPQKRRRFFMVGFRSEAADRFRWPEPTHGPNRGKSYIGAGDAFRGLPPAVQRN